MVPYEKLPYEEFSVEKGKTRMLISKKKNMELVQIYWSFFFYYSDCKFPCIFLLFTKMSFLYPDPQPCSELRSFYWRRNQTLGFCTFPLFLFLIFTALNKSSLFTIFVKRFQYNFLYKTLVGSKSGQINAVNTFFNPTFSAHCRWLGPALVPATEHGLNTSVAEPVR